MKKKVYYFLGIVAFFLIMPMGFALAQEVVSDIIDEEMKRAGVLEIIAEVNIRNAQIISQSGNSFDISFDLTNDRKIQPQVRYSVQLFEKPEGSKENEGSLGKLVDERVYPDMISLGEFDSVNKVITYSAPELFDGEYDLLIKSQNNDGMVYAFAPIGTVKLTGKKVDFLKLDVEKCSLTVPGEEKKFDLNYGVDVDANEDLRLECRFSNYFSKNIRITPVVKTFKRTIFGEEVAVAKIINSFVVGSGENQAVSFVINKADKPQSYENTLVLADENGNIISNEITFRYVIRGDSASIQNVRLDKDYYASGDIANITATMTGAADSFSSARKTGDSARRGFVSVLIGQKDGKECSEKISREVDNFNGTLELSLSVNMDCENPVVTVAVSDEKGSVLDEKKFFVETKTKKVSQEGGVADQESIANVFWKKVVFFVSIIMIIITAIYLLLKKKRSRDMMIVLFLCGLFWFMGSNDVNAYTYAVVSQDCSINVTAGLNKSSYGINEKMTATSGAIQFSCCNNNNATSAVNWVAPSSSMKLLTSGSRTYSADYGSHETNVVSYSSAGFATGDAPASVGSYTSPFILNVHTSYPFHSEWGESENSYVALVSYSVVAVCGDGQCNGLENCSGCSNDCGVCTTTPTAVITAPSNNQVFIEGGSVSFGGIGTKGIGAKSIDLYAWIDAKSGTDSYNKIACRYAEGTLLSESSSFSTSSLSSGTHRICLNVRQLNADDTNTWAGAKSSWVDVIIGTRPTATISTPLNNASYDEGALVSFSGSGALGVGGSYISEYAWIDTNSGTASYNKTACQYVDGTTLSSGKSFSVSNLSVGTHRICLNVKQINSDGTEFWAKDKSAWIDITINSVVGTCGSYSGKIYAVDDVDWGSGAFCSTGTPSPSRPSFPGEGLTTSWTCSGTVCSASRDACVASSYACVVASGDPNYCSPITSINCEKTHTVTRNCSVVDTCGDTTIQAASVCSSHGVSCDGTVDETCGKCSSTSNWIEVNP